MSGKLLFTLLLLFVAGVTCQADDSDIFTLEEDLPNVEEESFNVTSENVQNASTVETAPRRQFKFDVETLKQYPYEMAAVFGIFVYLFLYRIGKNANIRVMESFYDQVKGYIDQNFSHIGFTKNSG